MWRLLKAEFDYHRTRLRFAVLAAVIFLVAALISDRGGVYFLQSVTMIIFFVAVIIIGSCDERGKRDRLRALLPVPLPKSGAARLLFIVLLQSAFFALWLLVFLVRHVPHDTKALWSMLSLQTAIYAQRKSFLK